MPPRTTAHRRRCASAIRAFPFDSTGTGIQDVAAAACAYERACELGAGSRVANEIDLATAACRRLAKALAVPGGDGTKAASSKTSKRASLLSAPNGLAVASRRETT
jgi:hypothetical protein